MDNDPVTLLILVCRIVLAAVFAISAIAKVRDRAGSAKAVREFGVPAALVPLVAAGLPVAELGCAVLLLTADPGATLGAVASALLLGVFTVAIAVNLLQGRRPDCHCFGQLDTGETGWLTVGRNAVLIAIALVPLTRAGSLAFPGSTLASYDGQQLAVGLSITALALAVAALAWFCRTLLRQYGGVLLRLEALEAGGLPGAAREAPPFALPDLEGTEVSLDGVLDGGKPTLVAFISPTCEMCSDVIPDLAQWQAADDGLQVLVLSTGTAADNVTKLAGNDLRVLLQRDWEVAKAYQSQGTPCAYLVGVDGLIAGEPAYGVDDVRRLYASTVALLRGEPLELHQNVPRPIDVGDALVGLQLSIESGENVPLEQLTEQETVLLFWRCTCGFCASIVREVAALETSTPVLLVTGSDVSEVRDSGLTSPVVRDLDAALNRVLQIPGTPAAVRVQGSTLVSHVAVGGPEVVALLGQDLTARHA